MERRDCRITHAYMVGINLRNDLRDGAALCAAIQSIDGPFETLKDGYPDWHPGPHPFEGILKLFYYREITGQSYRTLAKYPELADAFGLTRIPDESVLSRAWRHRFDDGVREFIRTGAHYVVKEIHDRDIGVPAVRPKAEVVTPRDDHENVIEDDPSETFSDEQIYRTTRLAREHGFEGFDSERAANATYDDTQFFELQTYMGMTRCGTAQGATRFQYRRGQDYGPHGDTHLRAVKQFDPDELIEGFEEATTGILSAIASEASFRRPVTVALDITTVPYYGDVDGMPMVNGLDEKNRGYKFATLSIIGHNVPLVLAVEPVRESSRWDNNPSNQVHRTVRSLITQAKEHVPVETVLCDREFDSKRVYQTLENLDVNYLIPKRVHQDEKEVIAQMEADEKEVAVETAAVYVEMGSHPMRFLYVPSTKGEGTAVFATNIRVGPDEAEAFCRRYSRRWQIENEYKSIKGDFLAKTSSKDYRVRLFYFVFAVVLYNIWRLTDFLLKAGVDGDMEYAPILTAGECVELVCGKLIPPD